MGWDHSSEIVGYLAREILLSGVEAATHSFFHSFTQSQLLVEFLFCTKKGSTKERIGMLRSTAIEILRRLLRQKVGGC